MIVSSSKTAPRPSKPRRRGTHRLIGVLLLLAWTAASILAGVAFRDFIRPALTNLTGRTSVRDAASAVAMAPARLVGSWLDPEPVERLHLDIKFKHLTKIHAKRDEALAMGFLFTGTDDLVPAEIRHRGKAYRVKVRLKGDLPDHLETDKWSFRVHVRDGKALFGMRRFSIQAPATRGFHGEQLFFQTLRDEGVLAPRYEFVRVVFNGKDIGLMALEEHFSKELLESQQRREGAILKFDETLFWRNLMLTGSHGPFDSYLTAPIDAFRMKRLLASPVMSADLADGWSLLAGFVEGRVTASEAFDEELLGRFLAVSEIWRSTHAVRWHNLRFYFNPFDRELEPIGFDGNVQTHHVGNGLVVEQEPFARALLADGGVRAAFLAAVQRLADALLDGSLQARLEPLEARSLKILHREFPLRAPVDYAPLVERATALRALYADALLGFDTVHGRDTEYASPVVATLRRGADRVVLELRNNLPVPVEIPSVRLIGGESSDRSIAADGSIAGFPRTLPPTPLDDGADALLVDLRVSSPDADLRIEGTAVITGQSRPYAFRATDSYAAAGAGLLPDPRTDEVLAVHPFLQRDDDPGYLRIGRGKHEVRGPLALPRGAGLRLAPGTTLRFAPDAVLIVQGPLDLPGTPEQPIVLEPTTAPASTEPTWPGLVVLGAAEPSRWRHVEIRGTRGFRQGSWELTGGVTFYESDVEMTDCRLENTVGEDALNIVRSSFTLRDVSIRDTRSDAFDSDFSNGEIRGGLYEAIGGDAIDFSGSDITIEDVTFRDIRDKAMSVGENGRLDANKIVIERAGSGVVSKDRSVTTIRDSRLEQITHVAFMAYVKKPEYGPATLEVNNVTVDGAPQLAVAQTGSRVVVDGTAIPETELDVEQLYEEGYMRK